LVVAARGARRFGMACQRAFSSTVASVGDSERAAVAKGQGGLTILNGLWQLVPGLVGLGYVYIVALSDELSKGNFKIIKPASVGAMAG